MAVSLINIGTIANDGTGDDLREAFIKVNQNFEELDLRQPEATTASNLGDFGEGLFKQKTGFDLEFKKIIAGDNVTIDSGTNSLTFSATGGLQELTVLSDSGSVVLEDGQSIRFYGGDLVSTEADPITRTITINAVTSLFTDHSPRLTTTLDANGNSIVNVENIQMTGTINAGQITSTNFIGPLDGTVYGTDIRTITPYFESLDFGGFTSTITNWIDYLIATTDIDLGTIDSPVELNLDLGSL